MAAKKRVKIRYRVGRGALISGYAWAYSPEQAVRFVSQRKKMKASDVKQLRAVRDDLSPKRSRSTAVRKGAKRKAVPRQRAKRSNPPKLGTLMSKAVLRIEYDNAHSASRKPYFHDFKRSDKVRMYGLEDGSLRIVGDEPLWGHYMTKDSE